MSAAVNQAPGNCQCGGQIVLFTGCNNAAIKNYQIDIYSSSGGTLLESVTTDSSGHATVSSSGSVWVQGHDGRFSGDTVTIAGTVHLSTIGASYACRTNCAIPVARTTYFTDANGTWTLTYNGTNWVGCGSNPTVNGALTLMANPGCAQAFGTGSVVYAISVAADSTATCRWVSTTHFGASVPVSSYGGAAGSSDPTCSGGVLSYTGPTGCSGGIVATSLVGSKTVTCPLSFANVGTIVCAGLQTCPVSGSYTETE